MESVGGDESTEERLEAAAVGPNGPQTPEPRIANTLGFETRKHHAAVFEHRGMERAADVEVPNWLDVAAILIHDVEAQVRERVPLVRQITVAAGREHDPAARERAGTHVKNAVAQGISVGSGLSQVIGGPLSRPCWCPGLLGQAGYLARLHVDLVDIRP